MLAKVAAFVALARPRPQFTLAACGLRRFPFDRIKVSELSQRRDSSAIIRAVVSLSSEPGITNTVEGAETRSQLGAVASADITEAQGYLFRPTVPAGAGGDPALAPASAPPGSA